MKGREVLLCVKDLKVCFGDICVVDGVCFEILLGESFGVVGESGCGKSSLGKTLLRLIRPEAGEVFFDGHDWLGLRKKAWKGLSSRMQSIFQDPFASLNPRMRIGEIIMEGLEVHKVGNYEGRRGKVLEMLEEVGLDKGYWDRYPHELSGGQRQRVVIGRALILKPKLVICDEPVSGLDVSIQAQILNLMKRLQRDYGLAYLFISHDLGVVDYFCSRILVMYLGKVMEVGGRDEIFKDGKHPYTKALLGSVPRVGAGGIGREGRGNLLKGELEGRLGGEVIGCIFRNRCLEVEAICFEEEPELRRVGGEHYCACHKV